MKNIKTLDRGLFLVLGALIIVSLSFLWGCGGAEKQVKKSSRTVVRKKITAKRPELRPGLAASNTPSEVSDTGDKKDKDGKDKGKDKKSAAVKKDKGDKELADKNKGSDEKTALGGKRDLLTSIKGLEADPKELAKVMERLSFKVDPFKPLFQRQVVVKEKPVLKEKKKKVVAVPQAPLLPERRKGPLETQDLNQFKLVGIVRSETGTRAMVEEASGKGYLIGKGTYIGLHSGKVVDILNDRIVVEEKDRDLMGKEVVRTRELKFQRPEDYYEL